MSEASSLPVTPDDVARAAERVRGVAHHTPLLTSRSAAASSGADLVAIKPENLQRTGAFKFRGAYNTLSQLSEDERARGVLAYSSGNHAQAVALAGTLLGVATTIIMPQDAPSIKLAATRGYGAEVVTYDREEITREELAAAMAEEHGSVVVPPYDHPHVVAGQGTAGWELLEDAREEHGGLEVLAVCCGGGGLLSGCALAAAALAPDVQVVGVEPEAADDATRSFYSGTLHTVHNPDTLADGARTPSLGEVTFPLVRAHVDAMVTVPDDALLRAMRFAWERMKLVLEPTGALALAALLEGRLDVQGRRVGIVLSGGNVDLQITRRLLRVR